MNRVENPSDGVELGKYLSLVGFISWLTVLSPAFIESDAYRYAGALLYLVALYYYLLKSQTFKLGWMGWLCIGWGLYVLARFLFIYFDTPEHEKGSSEWLYIFPLLFPLFGLALTLYKPQIEKVIATFFIVAILFLLWTTNFPDILAGQPIIPMIQNNRIHGAVACGLIMISAFFWMMHYAPSGPRTSSIASLSIGLAPVIILLCLLNIFGSKSKGVWLAVVFTFPLMYLLAQTYLKKRLSILIGLAVVVVSIGLVVVFWNNIYETAGPTVAAVGTVVEDATSGADLGDVVTTTVGSDETPESMNERVQIWSNAWEIICSAPLVGQGNNWLPMWKSTRYANVGFTLMHNGYLEIAIRHGALGLLVMVVMLGMFLGTVRRAQKRGIISLQALHCYYVCIAFFSITLLSNSNNRLAIGEMFSIMTGAIAFFCHIQLQALDRKAGSADGDTARPATPLAA